MLVQRYRGNRGSIKVPFLNVAGDSQSHQLSSMAMSSSTVMHVKLVGGKGSARDQAIKISKYCHQCRQLAEGVIVACKKRKGNKFCTTRFCERCLQNSKKPVAISPCTVMHTPEASKNSSALELLDKEDTQILDDDRSVRGLHIDLNDVASENHVHDEKTCKKAEGGCSTEIGKENFREIVLPQPKTLNPTHLPPRKRLQIREMKHGF